MRAEAHGIAIGATVFLFGFGMACLAGYQAHYMTNEARPLDQEFENYQVLTVIGLIIASVGTGIATYGLAVENHENDSREIHMFGIGIGAVFSVFCLGTAIWAALTVTHMGRLRDEYESEYEALWIWSIVGLFVGTLGMVITVYGLSPSTRTHARKRPRKMK